MITRTQLTSMFFEDNGNNINYQEIKEYLKYLDMIDHLRNIGEYNSAVNYLAGAPEILGINSDGFDRFCNCLFEKNYTEEIATALDIFTIEKELNHEIHYIFSIMKTQTGAKIKDYLNQTVACVRGMRYECICDELIMNEKINVVDLGCAEGRLEQHYNMTRNAADAFFHSTDRSAYILIQAKYRNREYNNIEFYKSDLRNADLENLFDFPTKRYTIAVLSEFLEHMQKHEAFNLMNTVLNKFSPDKMIITTPNARFTALYKKDDPNNKVHIFEYDEKQLKDELSRLIKNNPCYTVKKLHGVGGNKDLPQSFFVSIQKINN